MLIYSLDAKIAYAVCLDNDQKSQFKFVLLQWDLQFGAISFFIQESFDSSLELLT